MFYFPLGTKMFQFPSLPRYSLCIQLCVTRHYSGGVAPFGDPWIAGYNASPWLFAGYCVLLRLLAPRYPPCALCSLTKVWNVFSCGRTPLRFQTNYWWNTDLNMQFSGYGAKNYGFSAAVGRFPETWIIQSTRLERPQLMTFLNS